MNHLTHAARDLGDGQLLRMDEGQGQRVECLRGIVWATRDRDPRDIISHPGDGFTIDTGGATLVSALRDARLLLLAPSRRHAKAAALNY